MRNGDWILKRKPFALVCDLVTLTGDLNHTRSGEGYLPILAVYTLMALWRCSRALMSSITHSCAMHLSQADLRRLILKMPLLYCALSTPLIRADVVVPFLGSNHILAAKGVYKL